MKRQLYLLAAIIVLTGGCVSSSVQPVTVRLACVDSTPAAISLVDALSVADSIALDEMTRVQVKMRQYDTNIFLRLIDYRVDVTETDTTYSFDYDHDNPSVPFVLWLGSGMSMRIDVNKMTGHALVDGYEWEFSNKNLEPISGSQ